MTLKSGNGIFDTLHVFYFVVAISEVLAEAFVIDIAILILKPLIPILLMILYALASEKKYVLFFLAMLFSALTNLFFIRDNQEMLFFAIISFMIHRFFIITLIIRILKIKDYIPVVIATIPVLVVFFYLFSITAGIPENSFWILIIQNILIAILGGIALSNYLIDDSKKNMWLLICGLLFIALQFIVFIERYYLSDFPPVIFRPIAMALNVFAFYTLLRFVLATENSDCDNPAV